MCLVRHARASGVTRRLVPELLLEHKPLIPWSAGVARRLLSIRRRNAMTRADWQALLFGLILLALCFVQ